MKNGTKGEKALKKQNRQSVLEGALILMAATVVVKVIGALFKIPLANILGGGGMGYFMTAYSLFNPLYALATAGLPVAVSKLVSESVARGRCQDAKRVFRLSLCLFLATGTLGCIAMVLGARSFSQAVGNPDAALAVAVMGPAVFFGCFTSAFRGYNEGLRNMTPTALSQVVEAVARLVFGIAFATYLLHHGMAEYASYGTVYGQAAASLEDAQRLVLPVASAGAVAGISVSTACGSLFLLLRQFFCRDGITREQLASSPRARSRRELGRMLLTVALPVCLASAAVNLTSLIDLGSIMNRLSTALEENPQAILNMYGGLLPEGMTLSEIPNYLYGSYTGLAVTVFNLVPALTVTFGTSALPAVSSSWAVKNYQATKRNIQSILRITALVAIPAGLGIFALSGPILNLLFSSRAAEAAIAAPVLRWMGLAVILVAMASPVNSMLQAVGRADVPVKMILAGGLVKLGCNYLLIAVPEINIKGAPVGTILCYGLILSVSLRILCRETGIALEWGKTFGKPFLAGIGCALCAWAAYGFFSRGVFSSRLSTLAAVAVGGGFYLMFLLFSKGFVKEDVLMLPGGEKVSKILEKYSLLG